MKPIYARPTAPTNRYRILKLAVKVIIVTALLVGSYHVGAKDQARHDAEVAATHDLLIRTALLASGDSPRPVAIPYTGVELNAFERGIVVDTWKRDQVYAKEER
jgi:hypothetical protein